LPIVRIRFAHLKPAQYSDELDEIVEKLLLDSVLCNQKATNVFAVCG
jgi:hypothetical protein